jgi:hypothetical protein
MKKFSGQIELTKLKQCVILEKKGQSGIIRGLFLPILGNNLDEFSPGRVTLPISIVQHEELDKYGNSGFIGQQVTSKAYKAATDAEKEEFKKLPILGNFKDFSQGANTPAAETIQDGVADLPF